MGEEHENRKSDKTMAASLNVETSGGMVVQPKLTQPCIRSIPDDRQFEKWIALSGTPLGTRPM
jgi:hypothetical protein